MCLWPEDSKYVPMVQAMIERVGTLPPGFRLPAQVHEYGLERQEYQYQGRTIRQLEGIDISEGSKSALALGLSNAIMAKTVEGCNLDRLGTDPAPEAVGRWMELYLLGKRRPDYRVSGVPENILEAWTVTDAVMVRMSLEEQRGWVEQQLRAVRAEHCA